MDEIELRKQRANMVMKDNALIIKNKFNLTEKEQKILLFLISQIQPFQEGIEPITFSLQNFFRVCGIGSAGPNYTETKDAIQNLRDRSMWIQTKKGEETLISWIDSAQVRDDGTATVTFSKSIEPYLLNLQQGFTRYQLLWVLGFKGKYTTRLYELAVSIHYHDLEPYSRTFQLDELRNILGCNEYDSKGRLVKSNYEAYKDFNTRVLKPAIAEINAKSDKSISYRPIKNGRAVSAIELTVCTKPDKERMDLYTKMQDVLQTNQLSFFYEINGVDIGSK